MITSQWRAALARRRIFSLAILLACFVSAGCATAPEPAGIAQFRHAIASTDQQAIKTFGEVNIFLRERQIERVVTRDVLDEAAFKTVLEHEDIAKWHRAFRLLDQYGHSLQTLLDHQRRTDVEDGLTGLGKAIEQHVGDGELPSGLAAAFSNLAGALLQIKTHKDARAAMQKASPGITTVLTTMREAIGTQPNEGIRGTVRGSWTTVLAEKAMQFQRATGRTEKRTIAAGFVTALDQRDAQDQALVALGQSLELLDAAHLELAAGDVDSAREFLKLLQAERARWQARRDAIETARAAETTP